ncbi:MAG: T9SS type A sorting domain-containing protein [Bacteroidota bacterium]
MKTKKVPPVLLLLAVCGQMLFGTPPHERSISPEMVIRTLTPIQDGLTDASAEDQGPVLSLQKAVNLGYMVFDLGGLPADIVRAELQLTLEAHSGPGILGIYQGSDQSGEALKNMVRPEIGLGSVNGEYPKGKKINIALGALPNTGKLTLLLAYNGEGNFTIASRDNPNPMVRPELILALDFPAVADSLVSKKQKPKRETNGGTTSGTPSEEVVVRYSVEPYTLLDKAPTFENTTTVFPNPTQGISSINWKKEYNALVTHIQVTDMRGKPIPVRWTKGKGEAQLDLKGQLPGVYLVNIQLSDGAEIQKKIIKK